MGTLKTEREKKLQRKLIPVNILVCILALVAALTLFLTPILKVDVGKILRDENTITFVDEMIDGAIKGDIEDSDQKDIDYKPVLTMLVKRILGKAEGKISISAVGALRVLTAGEDKGQKALDELLFGDEALATNLINSVVDGIADMFTTDEGKDLLEEALLSTLAKQGINGVEDGDISKAVADNIKELTSIFKELGSAEAASDDGATVARKFVDKIDNSLSADARLSEESKQAFVDQVTELYRDTKAELKEGEEVSLEAIICVTLSKNMDLSGFNLEELFDGLLDSDSEESSVHIKTVDAELEGEGDTEGEVPNEGTEGEGNTEGEEGKKNKIVTNYDDLLLEIGFDKQAKENLKEKMRTTLNNGLNKLLKDNGVDTYLASYQYVFYGMLVFIVPWLILFLFSFFHLLAKNKRFTMWYVKILCWIPSLIWLVLVLFPKLANKISVLSDVWNSDDSALLKAMFGGISSYTWINGLCYVLLWLVSIFWAFPIKRKIRKERKYPAVEDADGEEF